MIAEQQHQCTNYQLIIHHNGTQVIILLYKFNFKCLHSFFLFKDRVTLASYKQRFACVCLLRAETKGVCHSLSHFLGNTLAGQKFSLNL